MAVIKKTIVLSKGATKGYITVVKIGSQAGVKLSLNEQPVTAQWLLIKIGNLEPLAFEVHTMKEEYALPHNFTAGDSIGVAIVNRQGELHSFGGNRYGLDIPSFVSSLKDRMVDISEIVDCENCEEVQENVEIELPKQQEELPIQPEIIVEEVAAAVAVEEEAVEIGAAIPVNEEAETAPILEDAEEIVEQTTKKKKAAKPKVSKKASQAKAKKDIEQAEVIESRLEIDTSVPKNSSPNKANAAANTVDEDNFNEMFSATEITNFYSTIQSRLDEIFIINPKETTLAELIPDSKWVRVYYDKNEYYVVGVLSENNVVTHIAYGVCGVAEVLPPAEARELCDFLPIDEAGNGYWLMFQRSDSGAVIKNADL